MPAKQIEDFLDKLKQCSYQPLTAHQTEEDCCYNGVSYQEGINAYALKLEPLFNDFKAAVYDTSTGDTPQLTSKSVLKEFEEAQSQDWDIPGEETLRQYEEEFATGKYPTHRTAIREIKFLQEMVGVQKYYLQKGVEFLKGLLPDEPKKREPFVETPVEIAEPKTLYQKTLEKYGDTLSRKDMKEIFGYKDPDTFRGWEKKGYLTNISAKSDKVSKRGCPVRGAKALYRTEEVLKEFHLQEIFNKNH